MSENQSTSPASAPTVGESKEPPAAKSRARRRLTVAYRLAFLVIAVGLALWFLLPRLDQLEKGFSELDPLNLVVSFVLAVVATFFTFRGWLRLVRSDDSHMHSAQLSTVDAARLFFLTQLGKYIPGAVWPFVAQAEFGRVHKLPPLRLVTMGLVTLLTSLITGTIVAVATLPWVLPGVSHWFALLLVPALLLLMLLHPGVYAWLLRLASRITRRELIVAPVPPRDLAVAVAWSIVSWIVFGIHLWFLFPADSRGDASSAVLAIGCYAAAWLVGFALFFLPAGLVGREALLVLLLTIGLGTAGNAAAAALISRAYLTITDLLLAGVAVVVYRVAVSRRARLAPASVDTH